MITDFLSFYIAEVEHYKIQVARPTQIWQVRKYVTTKVDMTNNE